jgi:hypothetical protein
MSRPDGRNGSNAWWIVLLLLVLAAMAVALVWYLTFRGGDEATPSPSPSPSPIAWAGAWARVDGVGGGLIIEGSGDAHTVTAYDAALQPSGTVNAIASEDGRELRFTLPAQFSFGGPSGPLSATLTLGGDPDAAMFRVTGADQTTVSMPLQRVATLRPTAPIDSPTPSPTAPAPSPNDQQALRQQMIEAVTTIQAGIVTYAAANNNVYPPVIEVSETGAVGQYVDPWPVNPYAAGQPMSAGTQPGHYQYEQLDGGQGYRLTGHLDVGTFVVP